MILQPSAFMDVWVDVVIACDIRRTGVTPIFGDGTAVFNYIAVEDVAEFAVKILAREDVANEAIDLGGQSDISLNDLATLVERRLSAPGKRRHIPVPVMKLLPQVIRPFNEAVARTMRLGYFAATEATPFPQWKDAADRFGVSPETIEHYVERLTR